MMIPQTLKKKGALKVSAISRGKNRMSENMADNLDAESSKASAEPAMLTWKILLKSNKPGRTVYKTGSARANEKNKIRKI